MFKDLKIFFLIFFIIFIISFLIFNGAVFFDLIGYKINKSEEDVKEELARAPSFLTDFSSDSEELPPISNIISGGADIITSPVVTLPAIPVGAENSNLLEMPQFNIEVPILQVETSNPDIIYAKLNELEQGDRIYVFWNQKPLVFEVKDKNIFLPWPKGTESTETIFPPSDEITLILQSCWPVGIASKRIAVKTVLVR